MTDELKERRKRKQIVDDIAFVMDEMQRSVSYTWIEEEVPQKAIDIFEGKKE